MVHARAACTNSTCGLCTTTKYRVLQSPRSIKHGAVGTFDYFYKLYSYPIKIIYTFTHNFNFVYLYCFLDVWFLRELRDNEALLQSAFNYAADTQSNSYCAFRQFFYKKGILVFYKNHVQRSTRVRLLPPAYYRIANCRDGGLRCVVPQLFSDLPDVHSDLLYNSSFITRSLNI